MTNVARGSPADAGENTGWTMRKILFLISEDWFFVSHFLPMARAAQAAGFEVAVATRVNKHAERIVAEKCRVIPLDLERGSLAAVDLLRGLKRMTRIIRAENPDVVHCIALSMVILGGLAAKFAGAKALVLAPTGLGHLWTGNGPSERLLRPFVRAMIGWLSRGPRTHYLFENSDDPREFGLAPGDPRVTIVAGAGVRPENFPVAPEPPSPPLKLAVVARMLRSKGIADAVEATRRARALGVPVTLDIYGAPDPSNPMSIAEAELRQWSAEPGIAWHGATDDVARVWREHHAAIFLTYYREGLPKTLTEAAASGRAIIASDVVGCREVVRDGIEGLLVPARDVDAAAQAIARLATDAPLRARLGAAAHQRFQERLTEAAVAQTVGDLYRRVVEAR
jgi:glycosyltransferase involved in cell wall biosynthesis